jgi:hypothetical protein
MTNKMQNKTIVIAGDSWSCGELSAEQRGEITHTGLTEYLSTHGRLVTNLGLQGSSNLQSVERLTNFLKTSTQLQVTHVLFFQTEWTRDVFTDPEFIKSTVADQGYLHLKHTVRTEFYSKLSDVADQYQLAVYLIGGCSDIVDLDNLANNYPLLQVACQSMTNLLLSRNDRIESPVDALWGNTEKNILLAFKQYLTNDGLDQVLDDIEAGHRRLDLWTRGHYFFYPDGGHPNRKGHYRLYKFLIKNIPNLLNE